MPASLPPINALPESDFTAKMLVEGLPSNQDIFYRVRFRDLADINVVGERAGRPLPHGPDGPPQRELRLGRRCRRPGLGHQQRRRRHEDLRGHAARPGPISSSIPATRSTPTAS